MSEKIEERELKKKNILIYGAGSIGVFLGALLHKKGHNVTLYGRKKLRGLHESILINGKLFQTPHRIYRLKKDATYDFIFITTKLYDSLHALKKLHHKNISTTFLVLIQNGLVDESLFKDFRSHLGFVTISVFEGYRLIENQLLATKSGLGWQTEKTLVGKTVCDLLTTSGITCYASNDLDAIRAEKMMLVNAVGALSAIEKKTVGELIVGRRTKNIIESILDESYAVLKDDHALPSLPAIKKRFYRTMNQIKTHYSSMYQDVTSGRKTEIAHLNEYIVRLGIKKRIPTPINKKIVQHIRLLSKKGFST